MMVSIHCTWKNKALLIRFTGKMTVENARKIKKGLIQLYGKQASAYYADFSEITDVDITFVQLLIAFNLKMKNINSQLYILKNKVGNQLLDDLKIIGIDISRYFLISEGNNDFTGK
jgi:anti-anti-sigma regulatory factor